MKLILADFNAPLCQQFEAAFKDLPNVEIFNGSFERVPEFDCMVSAANSFGLMDGGVDLAIIKFFGAQLEQCVQRHILENYLGEQNVGTSFIVETGHPRHPFVAHTPTMRVPMDIAHTDNVYRAMWAMLLAVHHHNQSAERKINSVVCPGLGTGTGNVPFKEAARQMAHAYRNYVHPPTSITWDYALQRQQDIRYGGDFGFHIPPGL
jgi:O-acetyl-ADP-ribose deacetylase (regulator of RNase III)